MISSQFGLAKPALPLLSGANQHVNKSLLLTKSLCANQVHRG